MSYITEDEIYLAGTDPPVANIKTAFAILDKKTELKQKNHPVFLRKQMKIQNIRQLRKRDS